MTRRRWLAAALVGVLAALWILARLVVPPDVRSLVAFAAWKRLPWNAPSARDVPVRGVILHTETYGAGDPVLVMHGAFAFLDTVGNQIRALSGRWRVIAIDSRGHGRSTDGPGPITYDEMAEDASAVLRELGVQRAHVVGWSDGANNALLLAIHHPEQVRSVVAISPNADPSAIDPDALPDLGPLTLDNPIVHQMRSLYERTSPQPEHFPVFFDKMVAMFHTEPHIGAADLARIRAPTLILGASHDIMSEEHLRWIASAIPGAEIKINPDTRHAAPLTNPGAVDAAVVDWVSRH
jgi:pimeloyl-ACP methyl ester carboxylesterase